MGDIGRFEAVLGEKLGIHPDKEAWRKLSAKFFYDPRWKILNGVALRELLPWMIDEARPEKKHFRLYYIDLHDLHKTNRQHGDQGGDALLGAMAASLKKFYPGEEMPLVSTVLAHRITTEGGEVNAVCGRWGGDEFLALILSDDKKALAGFEDKLRVVIEQGEAQMPDGTKIMPSTSLGKSDLAPEKTWQEMLEEANAESDQEKKERGLGRENLS